MFYHTIFVVVSLTIDVTLAEPNVVQKSNVNWNKPNIWRSPIFTSECGKSTINTAYKLLIANGNKVQPGEFPWHAAVYESDGENGRKPICGASIISSRYLLSAAHCFYTQTLNTAKARNSSDFYIVVGKLKSRNDEAKEDDEQRHEIMNLIIESYKGAAFKHQSDIILIMTKKEIIFNSNVSPICLINEDRPYIENYTNIMVAGWGFDESGKQSESLMSINDLPFVSNKECSSFSNYESLPSLLTSDKFCTGRKGGTELSLDQGDSGGGIVTEGPNNTYYLIGIVSLKFNKHALILCTYVPSFHDWISEVVYNSAYLPTRQDINNQSSSGAHQPNSVMQAENTFEKASRIVESKCKAYGELIYKRAVVSSKPGRYSITRVLDCNQREPFTPGKMEAEPKEFPHMAALGYYITFSNKIEWKCSGSLISERFVLSAGRCNQIENVQPVLVMLGELNYNSDTDDAKPKYYSIVERYIHPSFKKSFLNSDIILLKLNTTVEFNAYMRPICLSTSSLQPGTKALTTAWAATETAVKATGSLMKATTGIIASGRCVSSYEGPGLYENGLDISTIICAEYQNKEYLCQGSKGGSLQIRTGTCMWSQFGIASARSFLCEDTDNPELVYTNVTHYIQWIQSIVWPTSE